MAGKYARWYSIIIYIKKSLRAERCDMTDRFQVKVGLHQGSALSPSLFAIVMDRLTDETNKESPWTMLFADDCDLW